MNDSAFDVSVIIPTFNRAHTIGRAIASALAQTQPVAEILVIDDASTDDLAGALAPFGSAVRCIRHDVNQGAPAARNTGLREAACDWVAFLDSDDAWLPHKLERQRAFMVQYDLDASSTNCRFVWPGADQSEPADRPYGAPMGLDAFVWGCFISPGTNLVARKQCMLDIGGYDTRYPRYEDWDLLIRLAWSGSVRFGYCHEVLAEIHRGPKPDPARVAGSLDTLQCAHLAALRMRDPGLAGDFRAALHFARAANEAVRGRYVRTLLLLMRSLLLRPIGNQAFRIVMWPKIGRRWQRLWQ
ncbi:MAG TPA: glycosyltransferase family 2 protein [bacterium]|nr:glycosyltransferase family 2 protein [bacterium]